MKFTSLVEWARRKLIAVRWLGKQPIGTPYSAEALSARNKKIYEFGRLRPYAEEPVWRLWIHPLLKASTTGLIKPKDYSQD